MKSLISIAFFFVLNNVMAMESPCIMYYDNPTSLQIDAFPHCEWRASNEFDDFLEKNSWRPLEPGDHCRINRETKIAKPDAFNCSTNDLGIPNQAYHNRLFMICQRVGPAPSYHVLRTWNEQKDIYEGCVAI
jgi:hypothetical protein